MKSCLIQKHCPHPFDTTLLRRATQGERTGKALFYSTNGCIENSMRKHAWTGTPLALSVFRNEVEKNVSNGCGAWVGIFLLLLMAAPNMWPTAGQSSSSAEERSQRNYFGTAKTFDGDKPMKVEYIAIGTRVSTDHIYVYGKPADSNENPQDHKTEIDLAAVTRIQVPPQQTVQKFQKTDYIELQITFKGDKTSKSYLVEKNRFVFCDELDGTYPIPQEIRISAVEYIVIDGVQSADLKQRKKEAASSAQADRKRHSCTQAAKALRTLEEETEKLPAEQKNVFNGLVDSVKNWVGGICNG